MGNLPLPIGAALMLDDLEAHRDWLFDAGRDLEIQDFLLPEVLDGDWQATVTRAKRLLRGFTGRRGIHGPFHDMPLDARDPEVASIVSRRMVLGVEAAAAIGATQMVIHSPFTYWDAANFGSKPRSGTRRSAREACIARVVETLRAAVAMAEAHGVTLVIENVEDIVPDWRRALADAFQSACVAVSLDTGHAHNAADLGRAPPVDYFVHEAGARLAHVHLQDTDGFADRHWPPGRGTINWHAVFEALAALPERPHLVLELRDAAEIPEAMAYLGRAGLAC